MGAFKDQMWVTSVISDDEVRNALVLCCSLKRAFSSRRVAAIASAKLSNDLREKLSAAFDLVFILEEDRNGAQLKLRDFAKLSALSVLRSFAKGAYLSPSMIAVKNPDDIFRSGEGFFEENGGDEAPDKTALQDLVLPEGSSKEMDLPAFVFKPSLDLYYSLTRGLAKNLGPNGSSANGLATYLKTWMKNQLGSGLQTLDGKYNKILKTGSMLLGNEKDICIVNLVDLDPLKNWNWNSSDLGKLGLLGKRVLEHWLKIYREDVQPLMVHQNSLTMMPMLPTFGSCYKSEPIAIVGMSCRFPKANSLEEFWNLLYSGEDGTSNPPQFRWLKEQSYKNRPECRSTNAGFLQVPLDEFDAKFFNLSPKELLFQDPQHRLLHELVWEGLEDACIDAHSLKGTSGSVFIGSWLNDYKDILVTSGDYEFYRAYMGTSIGAAAARISHLLEMTGPSIATESGCSSAMVAVHLACKSLQLGETDMALACGVNLLLHPFDKDVMPMVISADGHCKTFCEKANGFARGEGCGVLVLKRLSDAVKEGDNIWGLIRGTAISQEGISKSMGTPTVKCESLAMTGALKDAGVEPEDVSYVEAHGTGTIIGDPLEVAAIAKSYGTKKRQKPLLIGSVKTNVGHTESCSGITGIIKVILSMRHEMIPAHRNFEKLNPSISLEQVPAVIPLEPTPWKRNNRDKPRIAGVSSFGITGTDAHVIIQESPGKLLNNSVCSAHFERPLHILKLSAKTDEALEALLRRYDNYFSLKRPASASPDMSLADISFSANAGRANFSQRAVLFAKSSEEMGSLLQQRKEILRGETLGSGPSKICFLFTGQGSQYPGMAQKLYETSPTFQLHFDLCDKILKENYAIDIKAVMWAISESKSSQISRTIYSQTSIFCVEYALLKLWESWGVKADYCVGHSLGEFAAAVCSGFLTVENALKLVAERSLLIDQLPQGKMLVIKADFQQVNKALSQFSPKNVNLLDFAAINSSTQTVVAGDSQIILNFAKFLQQSPSFNYKCLVLQATHAFHSRHMDPILERYRNVAATILPNFKASPLCSYISGMWGNLVQSPSTEMNADYWVAHTREKVNFLEASSTAVELGCRVFIEIGPQPVLSALTMLNSKLNLVCLPSLKKNEDEWTTLLSTVGKLYVNGLAAIDWQGFDQFYQRKKLHQLPNYPFIGKKFWPDVSGHTENSIHPLIGSTIANASSTKLFQCVVNLSSAHEFIKDHVIGENAVFPGAGYLEMCLAAGLAAVENSLDSLSRPSRPMKVENLRIEAPLGLEEGKSAQIQTVVEFNKESSLASAGVDWNDMTVQIFHRLDTDSNINSSWLSHAKAVFSPLPSAEDIKVGDLDVTNMLKVLKRPKFEEDSLNISSVYEKLASIGLKFGPVFRSIEKVWRNSDNSMILAEVRQPPLQGEGQPPYILHPAVLDAMIQGIMMLKLTSSLKKKLYVPIKVGRFVWLADNLTEETYICAYDRNIRSKNGTDLLSTEDCVALLLDGSGNVLGIMSKVEFIDTTARAIEAVLEQQTISIPDLWEEVWRPKMGPLQNPVNLESNESKFYTESQKEQLLETYNKLPVELQNIFDSLEKYVYLNILKAFYDCGWIVPPIFSQFLEEELFHQLQIEKEFRKLFTFFLTVFQEEGILKKEGGNCWKIVRNVPTLGKVTELLGSPYYQTDLVRKFHVTLLFTKVGENLGKILTGRLPALNVLFPDESLKKEHPSVGDFYEEYGSFFKIEEMIRSADLLWLKHVKNFEEKESGEKYVMRILEIGAGTGRFSKCCMELFEESGFEFEYSYTDISAAFFPAAGKKLEKWGKMTQFRKLNIEEDPISQGFIPGYYDYICASDVVHATRNISETLENVKILLKPMGRFDMVEMTRVNRFITYLFGLLDGFWRFEDFQMRKDHCTLSTEKWAEAFKLNGFDVVGSFPCVNDHHSLICTRLPRGNAKVGNNYLPAKWNEEVKRVWVIFHQNDSKISRFLGETIEKVAGRRVIQVTAGDRFQFCRLNESFSIRKHCEEDFVGVMKTVCETGSVSVEGIIYAWSLDKAAVSQDDVLQPYFYVAKALAYLKQRQPPRLICLSSGIMPIDENVLINPEQIHGSTIWGFTKSLRNENIELNCRCIDIGAKGEETDTEMMQIFYEIWNPEKETQVGYNGVLRYTTKFQPLKQTTGELKLPLGTDRFQLILPETKSIGDLQFGPLAPLTLGEKEVEIQVKASALNFRDVFSVLKPSEKFKDVNAVGFDLAGVVKRIGSNVSKWEVGDSVFGVNVNGDALPSHVKLNESDLLPVGDEMSFCEAATLPAVFATSYYCLIDVAKVTSSDTVLIHTASGGVGLSAIELCKYLGAKIICTAGSRRKQNYLRSLGIQHAFHSRNTNYGREILEITGGKGVSVVLNSLTSEGFKEATLTACGRGARFVEMSKLSIWEPEEVKKLRPDVIYRIVDVASVGPSEWRRLMKNLQKLAKKKVVNPIPFVRFDGLNIREALQYMQKAKHIGKVVCVMPEVSQRNGTSLVNTPIFNEKSSYLISGGLGGIGFTVCQWMVEKGARYVLLAGRNPPNSIIQEKINQLNREYAGSHVTPVQLDVGDFEQCRELLEEKIPRKLRFPGIKGVMHCAGVLQDGLIQNQDWKRLSSTLNTKVKGTLNLHELTKNSRLEHFVLFSSIAALFGSPGQSNHAAGNNFEDSFAHYRNSLGLPATSVNWGQWGQVGVATEVDLPGLKPFSNLQGISALEFALKSQRVQTCAVNIESFVLLTKLFPHVASYLDEKVWKANCGGGTGCSGSITIKSEEFWEAYDSQVEREDKLEVIRGQLCCILKNILKLDETDVISDDQNFQEIGVDSLMFIEIKNALQALFGERLIVNASALRDCNNIKLLSETLVKMIDGVDGLQDFSKPPTPEEVVELIREDCLFPEHIRVREGQNMVKLLEIHTILLTGCTGTLGPYVLRELCQMSQISKVICLMRSSKSAKKMEERLKKTLEERDLLKEIDMGKVSCVSGNVALEHLGMEETDLERLSNEVDAIFHCAASVLHMDHYKKRENSNSSLGNDMRSVNVAGIKNVLEFSVRGEKVKQIFHSGSLLAVTKVDEFGTLSEDWPEIGDYDGVTTLAYPITKFIGDVLMKEAILNRGIPGKVLRLPFIIGDSKTGRFVLNQNHIMLRYLFILKSGLMPDNPFPMNMIPVDICAKISVDLFFNENCKDDVYNVIHNKPDVDQEFVNVAKKLGYNVEIVEFGEFANKVRDSTTEESPFAIFKDFYTDENDFLAIYTSAPALSHWLVNGGSENTTFCQSRKLLEVMPDIYDSLLKERPIDGVYRDLLFARDQGWLRKYGLK